MSKKSVTMRIMLIFIIALLASLTACKHVGEVDYSISGDYSMYLPGGVYDITLNASENGTLYSDFTPQDELTYEVTKGSEYASFDSATMKLTINENAPVGEEIQITLLYRDKTATLDIVVTKVEVETVEISAESNIAYVGGNLQLTSHVYPENATFSEVTYSITAGEEQAEISENGIIDISGEAEPDSTVTVIGTADGVSSEPLEITITCIDVQSVQLYEENSLLSVPQGGTLNFNCTVLPVEATYPSVTYLIHAGGNYGEINAETGILTVFPETPVSQAISVRASADGVFSSIYTVLVIQPEITGVVLTANKETVEIGGEVEFLAEIQPYSVYGVVAEYEILEGYNYAVIEDGILTIMPTTPSGATITVQAWAENSSGEIEGTRSNTISISVYKVDVTSVELYTEDNVVMVAPNGTVAFNVNIYPENSTDKTPQYYIVSGSNNAVINRNTGVLTISRNSEDSEIRVMAIVDGIDSNTLTVTAEKYFYEVNGVTWNDFDAFGSPFGSYRNIYLSLAGMPADAELTTVVVPNTVKRLTIEGNYSMAVPNSTENLFFYFYQATNIDITLINVGIEITGYSNNTIFDLPENSSANFTIIGENHLHAGKAINPYDYAVDGLYDPDDDEFVFRKCGMPGYNGAPGGTAISGYTLTFTGSGSIDLRGGDGAPGSPGGNGADVPSGESGIPGTGGNGGAGGDAGWAVVSNNLTINMSSNSYFYTVRGNAGKGGAAGIGGANALGGGGDGDDGEAGLNGDVSISAIRVYNVYEPIRGIIYQEEGTVSSVAWSAPAYESINTIIARMEKLYYVDMHIEGDLYNPYDVWTKSPYYPMDKLYDDNSILFMLRIIDNVLSKYPQNIFREIYRKSSKIVNIYLVESIKSGTIAGLASTANNVWLAYSPANIRNIFYSDVENFTFHELTHILHYNAQDYFSETTVRNFNNSYGYISSGTIPADGLYNPNNGYTYTNSYFLTSYSRRAWNEDVCETLSIIARQGRPWDFMSNSCVIRSKMIYICSAIDNAYETSNFYEEEYWERYLN
jgi:hypothetical protein